MFIVLIWIVIASQAGAAIGGKIADEIVTVGDVKGYYNYSVTCKWSYGVNWIIIILVLINNALLVFPHIISGSRPHDFL